jgi:hypothetical protein
MIIDAKRQTDLAFSALREAIMPWREANKFFNIAIGGDSHSGEWSIVHEQDKWLVFIGERGERMNVAIFSNPWDAASYAGYRSTSGLNPLGPFPVILPRIEL